MIEETLASLVERFNRHAEKNPAVGEELKGLHRTIAIHLREGPSYQVELAGGRLTGLKSGNSAPADLTITTDAETFLGLVRKEIGPMKALVTRRLQIDGSLEDKLLFRKLL
ncbi:MAG TPA: SCP2 sterol-binding domain-containing protein [Thermoplasmata archaeon]|nr:SCP2 sterol-binding domain-containing protein [Thermoplasmata archaeon]